MPLTATKVSAIRLVRMVNEVPWLSSSVPLSRRISFTHVTSTWGSKMNRSSRLACESCAPRGQALVGAYANRSVVRQGDIGTKTRSQTTPIWLPEAKFLAAQEAPLFCGKQGTLRNFRLPTHAYPENRLDSAATPTCGLLSPGVLRTV